MGVENRDIFDLANHKVNHRKAFKGMCLLLIQATNEKGIIEIKDKSDKLETAMIKLISE